MAPGLADLANQLALSVGQALDRINAEGIQLSSTLGRHTNDKMVSFYVRAPGDWDIEFGTDGMRVDVKGNVYCTGPGGVWVWDPDGNHLGTILMPESTANFNWGDADYATIYFSSRTSIYRLKTKTRGFVPGVK